MKNFGFYVGLLTVTMAFGFVLAPAQADDVGCKCMLCFTSPQGPKQFVECHEPVKECERRLARGDRLNCEKAKTEGVEFEEGVQEFLTCEQSYGEGYEQYQTGDWSSESFCNEITAHDPECSGCRKVIDVEAVEVCDQGEGGPENCEMVEREIYDIKPIERNPKPNYIDVMQDGKKLGETYYYKLNN